MKKKKKKMAGGKDDVKTAQTKRSFDSVPLTPGRKSLSPSKKQAKQSLDNQHGLSSEVFNALNSILDVKLEELTTRLSVMMDTKIAELEKKSKGISKEITKIKDDFNESINYVEDVLKHDIDLTWEYAVRNEQYSRKNNLRILGIDEQEGEDLECKFTFYDLQQYLGELVYKFSVIGISEMWLNIDNESQTQLPGYSFVNNNRNAKTGGGVGMFISSVINFHVRNDLNLQRDGVLESIFVETSLRKNEKIIIGTIYRPPNSNFNEFEADLKTILRKVDKENKTCILMGDFNIDLIKYESSDHVNRFLYQMYSSHFYPLINRPTRITANSATLIDNIFINNIHLDCVRGILISDLSDHLPVFQIFPSISTPEPKKMVIKKRAVTKANMNKLRSEVQKIN